MAYERCDSCRGTKVLLSLGGIYKDCSKCKGVGFIALTVPADAEPMRPVVKRTRRKAEPKSVADVAINEVSEV